MTCCDQSRRRGQSSMTAGSGVSLALPVGRFAWRVGVAEGQAASAAYGSGGMVATPEPGGQGLVTVKQSLSALDMEHACGPVLPCTSK